MNWASPVGGGRRSRLETTYWHPVSSFYFFFFFLFFSLLCASLLPLFLSPSLRSSPLALEKRVNNSCCNSSRTSYRCKVFQLGPRLMTCSSNFSKRKEQFLSSCFYFFYFFFFLSSWLLSPLVVTVKIHFASHTHRRRSAVKVFLLTRLEEKFLSLASAYAADDFE